MPGPSKYNMRPSDGTSNWSRISWRLPRPFSLFDGFAYGVYADSIIIAAALTYSLTWPWNDANIPLGIVMVCLAFVPMFTVYAMLTTLMPRPGGDYVWQSRILGGFWGYVLIFTPLVIGPWFYMASNVAPGSVMVAAPLLISLSEILDLPILVDFAISIATRDGTWWFYVIYVHLAAAVVLLGMRFYSRVQRWSFMVGCCCLALWVLMLLATSRAEFQAGFDAFMQRTLQWGDGHAGARILTLAREHGFQAVPLSETSWTSSFLIGPALAYTFMYIAWTGTLVGEIRGVKRFRGSASIFLGGNLFAMVVCAGFMWLLISRVGNELFTSSNFLWATGEGQLVPVPPHYGLFLMSLSQSPWYWLLVAIGLNAWFWIWPTNNMIMSTRIMTAMAHDQVLPGGLSRTSRRRGTPVVAVVVCYVGALVLGWLYFYTDFARLTLDMPFMTSIAFAASTLVGTLFPYLKKTRTIYQASQISRYHVGGVPLITICGCLGLVYFGVMFYLYITDSRYGTNDPLSAWSILACIFATAVCYAGYRVYRRKQGIDVSLAHREIPLD